MIGVLVCGVSRTVSLVLPSLVASVKSRLVEANVDGLGLDGRGGGAIEVEVEVVGVRLGADARCVVPEASAGWMSISGGLMDSRCLPLMSVLLEGRRGSVETDDLNTDGA